MSVSVKQYNIVSNSFLHNDTGWARNAVAPLRRSVLERAFRGELVPQDPSDEPASVLLDRIVAIRAAAPTASKRRTRAE